MNRLLRFETRKMLMRKSLYIVFAVMVGIQALLTFLPFILARDVSEEIFGAAMLKTEGTGAGSTMITAACGSFTVFTAILIPMYITGDYLLHTNKTVLASGYSRTAVFTARFIVSEAVTLLMLLLSMAVHCVLAVVLQKAVLTDLGSVLPRLLAVMLLAAAITAVWVTLSCCMRSNGGAIAICLLISLMLDTVLSLLDDLFAIKNIDIRLQSISVFDAFSQMNRADPGAAAITHALIIGAVWLVLFYLLGRIAVKKQEV